MMKLSVTISLLDRMYGVLEASSSISVTEDIRVCSNVVLIESYLIYVHSESNVILIRSSRLSKDRERLWLQPATAADTGLYICMLR